MAEKGKDLHRDMKDIKVPVSISKEELDAFLKTLTDGGIEQAISKIMARFIPKARKVREQNQQSLSVTPLLARIPVLFPAIGDLPLALVDNLAVKPLVKKMCAGGLKARTTNKYVEYIKQVVKSLKSRNGEPVHKRTWDAETMDLPVVKYREQRRPALKAKAVSQLIADSEGQERVLYVLLGATGMRISEALAIETHHFVNDARTVKVEQQVEKDAPRIVKYLKTDTAHREIDLHPDVAEFLQRYMAGKRGLLSTPGATRRICTATWRTAGSRPDSLRWDSTRGEWAGIPSSGSARRGCVAAAVWRTSTTSGWHTSRRRCLNCTRISTRK